MGSFLSRRKCSLPAGGCGCACAHTLTIWPCGLRRWLQAPVRKSVGSNPTAVVYLVGFNCCPGHLLGPLHLQETDHQHMGNTSQLFSFRREWGHATRSWLRLDLMSLSSSIWHSLAAAVVPAESSQGFVDEACGPSCPGHGDMNVHTRGRAWVVGPTTTPRGLQSHPIAQTPQNSYSNPRNKRRTP